MFDKKHKSCVKRIHLVTNDALLYTTERLFIK